MGGQDGAEESGPLTQLLGPNRSKQIEQSLHSKWKTKQREGSVPGEHWHSKGSRGAYTILASHQVPLSITIFTLPASPFLVSYVTLLHIG